MNTKDIKLKYCELIMAMLGLVTENLRAVSFSLASNNKISIRFIVYILNDKENEILKEILCEFDALQGGISLTIIDEILESSLPIKELKQLEHIVFSRVS